MKRTRVNYQISVPKVRLIDEEGKQIGVVETRQAIEMAKEKGLDLVEVAPQVRPPVCKIVNFGQYKYKQEKLARKQKKKQKKVDIKGVRISLRISENDLQFKARQADKFIQQGNKVRVELILRGREYQHVSLAHQMFEKFLKKMKEKVCLEQKPKREKHGLAIIIAR